MKVKIFTQDNCPNCPQAKKLGEELIKQGLNAEFYDVKTPQGLAESLMHNVLSTPSIIIIKENKVVEEFLAQTPQIEEVKKWL
ncbi:MAG: thioredoxin family protein [Candidatus Nanoarchaeia archaeon]|nr:thioredoxin family protein [Candidatus Nanoarchaeia archaeon]MDD5053827.1 thioredoxin family protein [Candidatus Nanoarchaeia archaeon]MDD5499510.1 thioredoxin family protein [Candidatus Nanoarchaeia archaeon]